jgi:antirestriction protein ArdC
METQTATPKNSTQNVQVMVNDKIIEQMEKGIVPWRTSWAEGGVPTSLMSKRPFRGINVLLLATIGYEPNLFITPKQLEKIGGTVKQDETPHSIVFWSTQQRNTEGAKDTTVEKKTAKLNSYSVYNITQCTGIPDELIPAGMQEATPIKACETIAANVLQGPSIRHKEPLTYYDPLEDYINLPRLKTFANPASYYSVLFHQLAHSTGHHTRADRMGLVQMSEYGCGEHTLEELVAEITTSYLENYAGIPSLFMPEDEYIDGWIRKFKSDPYFIFSACTLAQKAIDFILNIQDVKEDATQEEE